MDPGSFESFAQATNLDPGTLVQGTEKLVSMKPRDVLGDIPPSAELAPVNLLTTPGRNSDPLPKGIKGEGAPVGPQPCLLAEDYSVLGGPLPLAHGAFNGTRVLAFLSGWRRLEFILQQGPANPANLPTALYFRRAGVHNAPQTAHTFQERWTTCSSGSGSSG